MHVVDQIEHIYINVCEPVHPPVKFLNHFIIISIFRSNFCHCRSTLDSVFLVETTIECVQQCFCKVCTGTEELDLFTCLCCGNTAADRIVISPFRFHNFVILILDGTCINGDLSRIFFESSRKVRAVKNGKVRFRAWSHVFQSMKETIVCLCYHMASVQTCSANFQGYPGRVT